MTALTEFLFPAPARRTVGGIIGWWEARRIRYNLIVGAAGLFSFVVVNLVASLPPNPHAPGFTLLTPILVFGFMANACYTLGPAVEILIEKLSRGQVLPTGPLLLRMGLTFSVGLALLPTLLIVVDWLIRLVGFLMGVR